MPVRYSDGIFVGASTGGGKSELINYLASNFQCQELLYDTKDEFTVPGVEPIYDIRDADWDQRIVHLIDPSSELQDVDRTFRAVWERRAGRRQLAYGIVVIVHELGDVCGDKPGATPSSASNVARKGRAHGIGRLVGAQRPRNIPRAFRSEVDHVVSMAKGFDPEDEPIMADLHKMALPEYRKALKLARGRGEFAYLWTDRRTEKTRIYPPLPDHLRARAIARGIDPSAHSTPERSGETPEPASIPEHSGIDSGTSL